MRDATRQWVARAGEALRAELHGFWREPWHRVRPSRHGLDIALLPSPSVRWCGRLGGLLLLVHAGQLLWTRHPFAALSMTALAAALAVHIRRLRHPADPARRLLVAADGRLHLMLASGTVQGAHLHPASMRLGAWLLLKIRAAGHNHVLLLGPDNVPPAPLAALRRRLQ